MLTPDHRNPAHSSKGCLVKEHDFLVWLVIADYSKTPREYHVSSFGGGELEDPFGSDLAGIYRTEADAQDAVARAHETFDQPGFQAKVLYDAPIAWLATFIILNNETGDAKYHAEPNHGGTLRWNDDRDVMVIFATSKEAEAWVAAHGGDGY